MIATLIEEYGVLTAVTMHYVESKHKEKGCDFLFAVLLSLNLEALPSTGLSER